MSYLSWLIALAVRFMISPNAPTHCQTIDANRCSMNGVFILSIGYDLNLMPVRTMVLQSVGYKVDEAYSCSHGLEILGGRSVDLVVICHSVPLNEQELLIAAVSSLRPNIPVLCLTLAPINVHTTGCTPACNTAPEFLEDVSRALPHLLPITNQR